MERCLIENNSGTQIGGAIDLPNFSNLKITNSVFKTKSAPVRGNGIYCNGAEATFTNLSIDRKTYVPMDDDISITRCNVQVTD